MIFTERTIRMSNDVCEIDNPIVLYRGDYNVEIRFSIIECPYKYSAKNSTNIIEEVDASYGQLVIRVPNDGSPIFSDIVETKRGSIVFTLSGEMIDESIEVGDYTFQIRLFDANKESRATIPPVENGISIREPIAFEDVTTTNEVGEATVGYALTTAATPEDAFDSQGNYNKTTWGTGNRITAAKLNKIEAGIDGVNQKVASGGTGAQGMTEEQAQQLNTAYAHSQSTHVQQSDIPTKTSDLTNDSDYVNSTYVTNKIAEASLSGGEGTPTDEQMEAALNNYFAKNPIEGDITSITEQIVGTNLFDKNNCLTSRPTDTGTASGAFSNWIPIKKGRYYSVNQGNAKIWYFYNTDKTYNTWSASAYPKYQAPCDGYVLINISSADIDTLKVAEGTNSDGAYEAETKLMKSKIPTLSRWNGKRWLCIGDSITTERSGYADKSYASMVASNLSLQLTNIAVGGKQLTDALTWVTNLEDTDFDLVTIMMGTNDHAYQGTISNITNNLESVVRKIQERMPNAVIAYITPIKRVFFDSEGNESSVGDDGYVQNHGTSLSELVDAMKIKCRELSIPCLDIYDVLDPKLEYVRKTYFLREDGLDGTHPSVLGHAKFIAPKVNDFLESLAPFWDYLPKTSISIPCTAIALSANALTFTSADPQTLTATVTPNNTTETIIWSTNNSSIAKVANGIVTPVNNGSCTITATCGHQSATCNVTVSLTSPTVTYTITNTLTNVTNSNSATSVNENAPYTATLTADDGYTLDAPIITMGGNDITSTVYSNGSINISNVTGNIVITCTATQNSTGGDEAMLLHSWNLGGETITDANEQTVYQDLTNNFNMIVRDAYNIGNDRYLTNGGGLLLEKTDSFTLEINVTPKTGYNKTIVRTGISAGQNIPGQTTVRPLTKGRFALNKGTKFGTYNLNGTYYAVDGDSTTTNFVFEETANLDVVANENNIIKITYDSASTVGKIYLNNNLVSTINNSLMIDGVYLYGEISHMQYGEIKLYRGIV